MHVQKTWDALLNAPLGLDDIILAEMLWAASKALFSGLVILSVLLFLGIGQNSHAPLVAPLSILIGMTFASMGLVVNALARGYDFYLLPCDGTHADGVFVGSVLSDCAITGLVATGCGYCRSALRSILCGP